MELGRPRRLTLTITKTCPLKTEQVFAAPRLIREFQIFAPISRRKRRRSQAGNCKNKNRFPWIFDKKYAALGVPPASGQEARAPEN
jgi:hypothetical protein